MTPFLMAEDDASSRRSKIQSEIDELDSHPWAGKYCDYMQGLDTGPTYVWLAPKLGAAYVSEGWMTDSDFGTVAVEDSLARIKWSNPSRTGRSPTERELIIVPYHTQIVLVPRTQIHAFCLAVRDKGKYPLGLLRRDNPASNSKTSTGAPLLPLRFKPYIDLPPIVTTVIRTDAQTRSKFRDDEEIVRQGVTIDAGDEDHVFPGMRFQLKRNDDSSFPMIEVKTVRRGESDAQLRYYVEPNKEIPSLEVGQTFTTSRW
jgi:hypothetical protein